MEQFKELSNKEREACEAEMDILRECLAAWKERAGATVYWGCWTQEELDTVISE